MLIPSCQCSLSSSLRSEGVSGEDVCPLLFLYPVLSVVFLSLFISPGFANYILIVCPSCFCYIMVAIAV